MKGLDVDLSFVADDELRELLEDYHRQALASYEAGAYLGAVVACGGVMEGMLTWALLQKKDRAVHRFKEKWATRREAEKIESWDVSRLIAVAIDLKLLGKTPDPAAWAVKEFRNFIHPFVVLAAGSARANASLAVNALSAVAEIARSLRGRVGPPPGEADMTPPTAELPTVGALKADVLKTSMNFSWLQENRVAGCRAPHSDKDLALLFSWGIRALVRLADSDEVDVTPNQVRKAELEDCHEPVEDYKAPTQSQIDRLLAFMDDALSASRPVAVSCGAGCGRTGTLLTCYLVKHGASADEAMAIVQANTARGPEKSVQVDAIRAFEARVGRQAP